MSDEPRRKRGRPPIDPTDGPAVPVQVKLAPRKYDALYRDARRARVSMPELIRRRLDRRPDADPRD